MKKLGENKRKKKWTRVTHLLDKRDRSTHRHSAQHFWFLFVFVLLIISKLFFKSAVPKIRYRECICGYIPGKRTISDNECLNNLPLLNHITYPSLKMIPDKDEVKELFYDKETGDPKLHWCLLVEIQGIVIWGQAIC